MLHGRKASAFAALGCTAGIVPSLLASILGLAVVIHTSALAFQVLKFAGVAYLLYLAWLMWRETGTLEMKQQSDATSMLKVSIRGFLINILNPKLTLFFLAFLPQFVPVTASEPLIVMAILGGIFMAMTLAIFLVYGFLANAARKRIIHSPRVTRFLQRTFAATFAMLGVRLAFSERL